MSLAKSQRKVIEDLTDITRMSAKLQQLMPRAVERAAIPTAGTRTMTHPDGGRRGRGSVPDPVLAEVMEIETGEQLDVERNLPVGTSRDPVLGHVRFACAAIAAAAESMRMAMDHEAQSRYIPPRERPTSSTAEACENCERHGVYSPPKSKGRCSACGEYFRRHGRERPQRLVVAERIGAKIRQRVT